MLTKGVSIIAHQAKTLETSSVVCQICLMDSLLHSSLNLLLGRSLVGWVGALAATYQYSAACESEQDVYHSAAFCFGLFQSVNALCIYLIKAPFSPIKSEFVKDWGQ